MITAPTRIDFIEPTFQHPNEEIGARTVFEVASDLELKYELLHIFIKMYKSDLERIISSELALAIKHSKSNEQMDGAINDRILPIWRAYILNEDHGIKTKASIQRGSASFVDTGTYYKGLTIGVAHE